MESKQNQLYRFYRGDSNLYHRGTQEYEYVNYRFDSKSELTSNYRYKPSIYFDSIDPAYKKCNSFCKGCNVFPSGINNITLNSKNCKKCKECLTPALRIRLKPLTTKIYPRYPKEKQLIPTPFPYLSGSHNVIPRIIPLPKESPTSRDLEVVSTSNIGCDDYCGREVCDDWTNQMNLYEKCQLWNDVDECRKLFGCKQWEGNRYRLTPPLHPHLTDCQSCWINNYTNI